MSSSTTTVPAAAPAASGGNGTMILFGIVALAALLAAPFGFYPVFLMKVMCFALFACAFNLLLGYTGLLSFGHAMFFGGSAYITAHAVKVLGFTPEVGILAGVVFAAALGLLSGLLAIRRQGIYFAMVTLALAQSFSSSACRRPSPEVRTGFRRCRGGRCSASSTSPTTCTFIMW